jgi:MFS family permease
LRLIYLESSVCALFACLGLGVGGNLPVDGALFLEFLPFASGNLLTMLSVWWPVGQLIARLVLTRTVEFYKLNRSANNPLVLSPGASSRLIAVRMTCPPAMRWVTESPAAARTTIWAGDTLCSLWVL